MCGMYFRFDIDFILVTDSKFITDKIRKEGCHVRASKDYFILD